MSGKMHNVAIMTGGAGKLGVGLDQIVEEGGRAQEIRARTLHDNRGARQDRDNWPRQVLKLCAEVGDGVKGKAAYLGVFDASTSPTKE